MSAGSPPLADSRERKAAHGFTLTELLVVIAVMSGLLALVVPAFTQGNAARNVTDAAYTIAGLLDNARAYAKANNTYTWVGFFEEKAGGPAGTAGVGRVVISVVASREATALYSSTDPDPGALPPARLLTVGKLTRLDNIHLAVLDPSEIPTRGKVVDDYGTATNVKTTYQVGDAASGSDDNFTKHAGVTNRATFSYPLSTTSPTYTFVKVIQFNPLGDATKIVESPTPLIEIGLRPARGETVEPAGKNCAAVQVDGVGGLVRIYRL